MQSLRVSDDGPMSTQRTHRGESVRGGPILRHHSDFAVAGLVAAKGSHRISVCIPARNEETTVAGIVETIVTSFTAAGGGVPLVDEVVVVDDGSEDRTAELAHAAGARVFSADTPGGGKGQAMATALGDLIAFVDADVSNFAPHFVTGLLGPLLVEESVALVKAHYRRPLDGAPDGGGRVTELMAKPVLDVLFPQLSFVEQPLAGETAAPRAVLEKCGLADGYAVELALLIDVATRFGSGSVAQVDLGVRVHRNRPLAELRPQATGILRAALERAPLITPD